MFLGIIILISQNWNTLGSFVQILATLGSACAAFMIGVIFSRYPNLSGPSSAFFLISGLVMPVGLITTFDKLGLQTGTPGLMVLISGLSLAMFLVSYFIFRKTLFTLFSIIFGTWLFQSFIEWIISGNPSFQTASIYEYRILLTGLAYILLGYYFSGTAHKTLSGFLYGFGSLGFLGAAMALGGWSPNQNAFWELIYPLLVFGIIYLSVQLKSNTFLVFGSLFLIGYILKLTAEYFSSGLGWPLALVLAGLIIIGVSYYAVRLHKKYMSGTPPTPGS